MYYPVYAFRGNEERAHSAILPDFGDINAVCECWHGLPEKVQESAETYLYGKRLEIKPPCDIENIKDSEQYKGGFWMYVNLNVSKLEAANHG